MDNFFLKIGLIIIIFFFISSKKELIFSSEFNELNPEILPVASFLSAKGESMRVGWYDWQKLNKKNPLKRKINKPVGSLFVQIRPKKNENHFKLAVRVLKDGSEQFNLIKQFSNGEKLNYKKYITIPFEFLLGAIQGEALRNIFPYDRVEFGGWSHQFTYNWETFELIAKSFTKTKMITFQKNNYSQGDKITIPWQKLRSDLELQPLALREPLFMKKDETGVRHAYYRFQKGDTLYSSVISRFLVNKNNNSRKNKIIDLIDLNRIQDPRQISNGQIIKLPLKWIKQEYFYQIPTIYRNFLEVGQKQNLNNLESSKNSLPKKVLINKKSFVSQH